MPKIGALCVTATTRRWWRVSQLVPGVAPIAFQPPRWSWAQVSTHSLCIQRSKVTNDRSSRCYPTVSHIFSLCFLHILADENPTRFLIVDANPWVVWNNCFLSLPLVFCSVTTLLFDPNHFFNHFETTGFISWLRNGDTSPCASLFCVVSLDGRGRSHLFLLSAVRDVIFSHSLRLRAPFVFCLLLCE